MKIVRTITEVRDLDFRGFVGLVPTMGAFHDGHVALFRAARDECDSVVVSLFVNSAQFGPSEDFDRYPRNEERDFSIAAGSGVDVVFAPSADEMYPSDFGTWVDVDEAGAEGAARPG